MRTTDADETLTPRQHHQRALKEKRARLEAEAAAEGHEASRACACRGCEVFFAVQAAALSRKMEPRRSKGQPAVEEAHRRAHTPRGG